jgi:hypothetical protein
MAARRSSGKVRPPSLLRRSGTTSPGGRRPILLRRERPPGPSDSHGHALWSQCFFLSYASVLPTSLSHVASLDRGFSPRRPAAVMSTICRQSIGLARFSRAPPFPRTQALGECSSGSFPTASRLRAFSRSRLPSSRKDNSSRGRRDTSRTLPSTLPSRTTGRLRNFDRISLRSSGPRPFQGTLRFRPSTGSLGSANSLPFAVLVKPFFTSSLKIFI